MSNEKQESLADIVADMRQGMNPNGTAECQYLESDICTLADRIEAAHKREQEDAIATTVVAAAKSASEVYEPHIKSSQVGNTAKMRKALLRIGDLSKTLLDRDYDEVNVNYLIQTEIASALAAPPRNCDVGTAEEQSERYDKFCDIHDCKSDCPLFKADCCELAWAQMPYKEKKGAE